MGDPRPASPSERGRIPSLPPPPPEVLEADLLPHNHCGDHVLVQKVGLGGYGVVYRAWHKPLGRWVALKFLHVGGEVELERFQREARLVAQLAHPGIVPVYDVGEHEGRAYITMQFIEGDTLDGAKLDPARAASIMADVADAVAHAHEHGIVHRDLKPSNLMLSRDGRVYVMDFGLARALGAAERLTRTGIVAGTPAYMSPEQAMGKPCDERSDVYSLGATLYELLTRHAPFEGHTPVVVLASVMNTDPVTVRRRNPEVPRELDAIVAKAMEKRPADRYQSARAFADDLRRAIRGDTIVARHESIVRRALKWTARHRLATALLAVVGAAVLALVAGSLFHAASMSRARGVAEAQRRWAEEKLAQSLISQGDALALAGGWLEARARYEEAERVLVELGQPPMPAQLGLMAALGASPPPLQVLRGHTGPVTAVAFAPDGRTAISSSEDGTARVWEIATGKALHVLEHGPGVWAVAASPDGARFASSDDGGQVSLWDARTGKRERSWVAAEKTRVGALAFSHDARLLLSGSEDDLMRAWDVQTGALVRTFAGHKGRVRGIEPARDGRLVITAGGDDRVIAWELATGKIVFAEPSTRNPFVVRLAPDARSLMVGGDDGDLAEHVLRGDGSAPLARGFRVHGGVVSALRFAPRHGVFLTASWDGRTRIFQHPSGELLRELPSDGDRVIALDVSSDERLVIDGGANHELRVYPLEAPPRWDRRSNVTPEFSADGRMVATWDADGRELSLWDVETRHLIRRLRAPAPLARLALAPDARLVVLTTLDRDFMLWEPRTDRILWRCKTKSRPHAAAFASGNSRIWVAETDAVSVYDTSSCERGPISQQDLGGAPLRAVSSRNGRRVAVAQRFGRAYVFDGATAKMERSFAAVESSALHVSFSWDDRRLLVASANGYARVFDVDSGAPLIKLSGHPAPIFAIDESADGAWIATGGGDRIVRLWDARTGVEVRALPALPARVSNVRFFSDGRLLAGADDGSFALWDPRQPGLFARLEQRVTSARNAIASDRASGEDWLALGDWFARRAACVEANTLYERGRALKATPDPLLFGRCLWVVGRNDEAAPVLARAFEANLATASYVELLLATRASDGLAPAPAAVNERP